MACMVKTFACTGLLSRFGIADKGKPVARLLQVNPSAEYIQNRTKYVDHRMVRDVKRRKVVKEYAPLRLNLNAIRKCDFLPDGLRDVASKDIAAFPTDSCHTKLYARCILTSRARGKFKKFRMSRIIWRHLADYNFISGVERAMW